MLSTIMPVLGLSHNCSVSFSGLLPGFYIGECGDSPHSFLYAADSVSYERMTTMKRLAVFFPGIGYTVDKPLMYYSRRLAEKHGFEICLLPYSGFPKKVKGDKAKMQESYKIALKQAKEMLSDIDFEDYDDILFVGKSIGTIVAAKIASKSSVQEPIRFIFYTPLEETFSFPVQDAIVFTGSADPWVEAGRIPALCKESGIPCSVIPDANHSLETADPEQDILTLQKIMFETEQYMAK